MPEKEKKGAKKKSGAGGGGGGVWSGGGWLVARLGVVGDVQWGCKPRIEGIVKS